MTFLFFSSLCFFLSHRRIAVSKSNGKICRITVELLSRHLQNEGIVEYGFRTLSFLSFVAVSVDLPVLQRVSMSTLDANKEAAAATTTKKGDDKQALALVKKQKQRTKDIDSTTNKALLLSKSTTQYMQDAGAVQLAVKALLKFTDPDGGITTTLRAVTSVFLAIGNLCHANLEGKLFIVSYTHNVKRFHLTGDFSHMEEEPLMKTVMQAGRVLNLKAGRLRQQKKEKRARYCKEYERSMQEEGVCEGDEAYMYWDEDAVPPLPFDHIDGEIET